MVSWFGIKQMYILIMDFIFPVQPLFCQRLPASIEPRLNIWTKLQQLLKLTYTYSYTHLPFSDLKQTRLKTQRWAGEKSWSVCVRQSSSSPGLQAPCLHSRTVALKLSPGFTGKQENILKADVRPPRHSLALTHGWIPEQAYWAYGLVSETSRISEPWMASPGLRACMWFLHYVPEFCHLLSHQNKSSSEHLLIINAMITCTLF